MQSDETRASRCEVRRSGGGKRIRGRWRSAARAAIAAAVASAMFVSAVGANAQERVSSPGAAPQSGTPNQAPSAPPVVVPAVSGDALKQANWKWQEGIAAVSRGDLESARTAFQRAYEIVPDPAVLQNLGEVEFETNRFADAARHFSLFLNSSRAGTAEQRQDTARSLQIAMKKVAKLVIRSNIDGADIRVDDRFVAPAAAAGFTWLVDPGNHTVTVEKAGYSRFVQNTVAKAGKTIAITATLDRSEAAAPSEPVAAVPSTASTAAAQKPSSPPEAGSAQPAAAASTSAPPIPPAEPASSPAGIASAATPDSAARDSFRPNGPSTTRRVSEFGLLGIGAGGLALGTIELFNELSKRNQMDAACPGRVSCTDAERENYNSLQGDASNALTLSIVGFAVGGAAIAGSIVLFATEPSATKAAASRGASLPRVTMVAPAVAEGLTGLSLGGIW